MISVCEWSVKNYYYFKIKCDSEECYLKVYFKQ